MIENVKIELWSKEDLNKFVVLHPDPDVGKPFQRNVGYMDFEYIDKLPEEDVHDLKSYYVVALIGEELIGAVELIRYLHKKCDGYLFPTDFYTEEKTFLVIGFSEVLKKYRENGIMKQMYLYINNIVKENEIVTATSPSPIGIRINIMDLRKKYITKGIYHPSFTELVRTIQKEDLALVQI